VSSFLHLYQRYPGREQRFLRSVLSSFYSLVLVQVPGGVVKKKQSENEERKKIYNL
jgi:hypothetical protein